MRGWLCLSALVPYAADVALTLLGQPPAYWAGDHASAVEMNPLARLLLQAHPVAFLGVTLAWAACFSALILRGPLRLAQSVAILLALLHGVGAGTWLVKHGQVGWVAALAWLVAVRWLVGRGCRRGA